ncbi:MAG: gliding motility lipoprotein GldH [Flavobacteriales bacterium]|nr:gliding motility lipoprotein GldH [Flavobacteriales bacterium]
MARPAFLILLLVLCTGCTDRPVFQADVPIDEETWDRSYKPSFTFSVNDSVNKHDVFIDVRHSGDYPFSDLFLFVDLKGPGGRAVRDTVECLLADPTGKWYGKGLGFIFADRYQAHVLYKLGDRFPVAGEYTVTLEQAMRTEKLKGVLDVGISVMRSQQP